MPTAVVARPAPAIRVIAPRHYEWRRPTAAAC